MIEADQLTNQYKFNPKIVTNIKTEDSNINIKYQISLYLWCHFQSRTQVKKINAN